MSYLIFSLNNMNSLVKNKETLFRIGRTRGNFRNELLANVDDDIILNIINVLHNVINKNIAITPKTEKALWKYRREIRKLLAKNPRTKNIIKQKRKLLVQKGGFLPLVLGPILAAIPAIAKGIAVAGAVGSAAGGISNIIRAARSK